MTSSPTERLIALDLLRGIAALGVCWFHFTNGNPSFLQEGLLKASGAYGRFGVEVFFVLSGFIIPFTLQRGSYQIKDYGTFLLKRVIRLDPPYIVAIAAAILLGYLSSHAPGFRGPAFHPSILQTALHLGYINVFFGYAWLNPVFWTLAIEFQYYLLMGLLFPLIANSSAPVRVSTLCGFSSLTFLLPADQFVFHWIFLFMLGMVAFQFHASLHCRRSFVVWLILLGIGSCYVYGLAIAGVGISTALVLGFINMRHKSRLLFFGHISYSLYLLHVPIGGRIVNLSQRFVHTTFGKYIVIVVALIASVAAAWLLQRYVEGPAQRWSSSIRYRSRGSAMPNLPPGGVNSIELHPP